MDVDLIFTLQQRVTIGHHTLDTWTLDVWKLSKCLECLMVFNEKFQMSNWPSKCRILVEKFQASNDDFPDV